MRKDCLIAISKALGRAVTQAEALKIEERVLASHRTLGRQDPQAWAALSQLDRLRQAGAHAAQEIMNERQLKQQREALTILAHARIAKHVKDSAARGVGGLAALDRVNVFVADGKSNFLSVESQAKSIQNDALRQMLDALEQGAPQWFGLFESPAGVEAMIRELKGEATGNTAAKVGADQFRTTSEALRQRFNRGGGDVGKLEDWGFPQHHPQRTVAKAGRETWVADVLPLLDRERYVNENGTYMNDAQVHEFLQHAWTSIATGGANKVEPGVARAGMRASRGSLERQIHFKDADGYLAYQAKYGERSLYESLVGHIHGIAKDIALVETWGPNPDHTFRFFVDSVVKESKLAAPTRIGKVDESRVRSENLYNEVAGHTQPVASQWLADSFDTVRSWLIASRLGSAVITSFSDDATLHLTAKLNHLPAMRVLANELAALNPANKLEERMANRAGLALNTLISSLNRYGEQGLGPAFARKLATRVMRISGMNAMTEARRRAFGVTYMHALGSVVREHATLAALDATDYRVLLSKGLTETDFAVWKKARLEDWGAGNDGMLTPESIYRISDRDLATLGDPQALREQAATRLLATILEETDVAVIDPGAKERAFMGAHLQRGTWKGEIARSFFLFKSFPLAMISRHWSRGMSLPNKGGRAAYLATLIAATTVAGMASLQVNEVLQGRDPRNMNLAKKGGIRNWIAAMLKGGSLGIYGDFLFSDATRHGGSPLGTLTGPVLGVGEDLLGLTHGNLIQLAGGQRTHAGAEAVKFVRSNTPGASLWYAKGALDHLIFHSLQEFFSPGYLSDMRSRQMKQFSQRFWWEPGEIEPERAPDFEAAIGE